MTWTAARSALVELLEGLGYDVFRVPPASREALSKEISVIMLPPAKRTERRRASRKQKVRTVQMDVVYPWEAGSEEAAGLAVETATDAIDDALDGAVTLGGEAVTVGTPVWTAGHLADYPPRSGVQYVQQSGEVDITLQHEITAEA